MKILNISKWKSKLIINIHLHSSMAFQQNRMNQKHNYISEHENLNKLDIYISSTFLFQHQRDIQNNERKKTAITRFNYQSSSLDMNEESWRSSPLDVCSRTSEEPPQPLTFIGLSDIEDNPTHAKLLTMAPTSLVPL